jgi:hypothetical protein
MQDDGRAIRDFAASLQAQGPIELTPFNIDRIRAGLVATLGDMADQYDVEVGPDKNGAIVASATPKKSPEERAAIERRTREIADDNQRLRGIFARSQATASKA